MLFARLFRSARHPPKGDAADLPIVEPDLVRVHILDLWAGVEQYLDIANFTGWQKSGRKINNVVPQALRWKLQLFKKLHTDSSLFPHLKPLADEVVIGVQAQKEVRNWMAHGFTTSRENGLHLKRYAYKSDGSIGIERSHWTLERLRASYADLRCLADKAGRYADALGDELDENPIQNDA